MVPAWLRDLAEDAWGQLNRLVGDPQDAAAISRLDEIRADTTPGTPRRSR